jgi:putative hydrolase
VRDGRNPLDDGILALLASPAQRETLDQVQGLMSLLEGHGDITMDRAGAELIPSASRFSAVLRQRRAERSGAAKFLQQVIGLDAKLRQYEQGERFIAAVEEAGGPDLLARVWQDATMLPTAGEILDPGRWVARVGGAAAPALAARS